MSLFAFTGGYIPAENVEAVTKWYVQILGCRSRAIKDEGADLVLLQFDYKDPAGLTLGPPTPGPDKEPPPIIYTSKISKAHQWLGSRGVFVEPIQQDVQGTKYFEMRDCCGNVLEVSEEP